MDAATISARIGQRTRSKCASLCSSVRGVSRADLIAFLTLDGPPRQQLLSLPMSDSPDVSSYSGEVGV